jgi:hypothetical protein
MQRRSHWFCLQLVLPYWMESEDRSSARWKLAGVFALTLGTTGVRCAQQVVLVLVLVHGRGLGNTLRVRQVVGQVPAPSGPSEAAMKLDESAKRSVTWPAACSWHAAL